MKESRPGEKQIGVETRKCEMNTEEEKRMKAVYKKELKAYFTVYNRVCIYCLSYCIYWNLFMAYNMTTGYPYFSYTLSGSLIVFIVGIPLITMRSFAEERKNKTDQILLTAPVSLWKVVVGKYLAMVTVIAIPNLIFCIFPLIIKFAGDGVFDS